jgi:DNA-directed RNA polymerase specialized sigma24 family protein
MTAMLAFCRCGHVDTEHRAGVGCTHINDGRKFPASAPCACRRFELDAHMLDAEEFLAKQLNHLRTKEGLSLEPVEREDLLQVMRISLWRASTKYDSRSHIRFGSFAAFEVYNDALDELRSARMFGRRGQHRLPPMASSANSDDDFSSDAADPVDSHDGGEGRLARVVAELTVDPADAGSVDLRWAAAEGDREAVRAVAERHQRTVEGAESGARAPTWHRGLAAFTHIEEVAA